MKNLKGTEKQVKYAEDIRDDIEKMLENIKTYVEKGTEKQIKRHSKKVIQIKELLKSYEGASQIINRYKTVLYKENEIDKAVELAQLLNRENLLKQASFINNIPDEFINWDKY